MLFGDVSVAAETEYTQKASSAFSLVGMEYARSLGYEGQGQTIVVLDDGVQIDHPNISPSLIDGFCASVEVCASDLGKSGIQYGKALADTDFHGSMVSGVAAGRATSVALGGVAPKANVISINVKNGNNDAIIRAINWILSVKDKYKIAAVNLSAGNLMPRPRTSGNPCDFFGSGDQQISDGIAALYAAGIPFVIASGNDFQVNKVNFPSCIPQAITVGSVVSFVAPDGLRFGNRVGDIASYSNIGPEIDVLAPSEGIATATNNGNYMIGSGTSSAAPFIAGVIALLKQAKPTATVDEIRMALATTINYKSDIYYSNLPLVHLPSAINALVTSTYSDTKVTMLSAAEAKILGDKALADAKVASDKALADAKSAAEAAAKIAQDKAEAAAKIAQDKALADAKSATEAAAKIAQDKAVADAKAAAEAAAKIAQDKAVADAKAAAEAAAKIAQDKAEAAAKIAQDKAVADAKAATEAAAKNAQDKAVADAKAAAWEAWKEDFAILISGSNKVQADLSDAINKLQDSLAAANSSYAKEIADAKAASDKAIADAKTAAEASAKIAQDKILADLAAANASLADSQKVNRELRAQLTDVEGQFLALSASVSTIQTEVSALNAKLSTALKSLNTANAKIKKICAVKPKPKGC